MWNLPEPGIEPVYPLLAGRFFTTGTPERASQVALVVKKPPGNAGHMSSSLGSGRSLGRWHGDPLQYSCLENAMDRGGWWDIIHSKESDMTEVI